ncbi:hypothetical protein EVAR_99583_1 [Eumeta japonica]|uniref:Uncharacterized protein n=1 Tax=Eumeta variegata TaxID=151549 RepID=A0A4C1ZIL6_EUMVA|nr:hypothetical protein EVAR_99583_1 [Eumeta japonica]
MQRGRPLFRRPSPLNRQTDPKTKYFAFKLNIRTDKVTRFQNNRGEITFDTDNVSELTADVRSVTEARWAFGAPRIHMDVNR